MTNVDALKNLYAALGGDPADVANYSTIVEVLNAISAKYGGADDAIINPEAINNIAAIASSIAGGTADLGALISRTITSVEIPAGVTTIGNGAFTSCSSLASVVIPEGVTSIGWSAFYQCSSLASVVIPEGVTTIGTSTFSNCSALASVVIPEGVTAIENGAFYNCSSLASVVIPSTVTDISRNAFGSVAGTLYCRFAEGAVSGAPWGATGTIVYDYNG